MTKVWWKNPLDYWFGNPMNDVDDKLFQKKSKLEVHGGVVAPQEIPIQVPSKTAAEKIYRRLREEQKQQKILEQQENMPPAQRIKLPELDEDIR